MSVDWVAVSGAASAAASVVALAGLGLAYKGARISRDASILDRRNYLEGIFVRWLDSVDVLDRTALPFLGHSPTQSELDSGSADLPEAYKDFHLAFLHCQTAVNLLAATGLFDHKAKDDPPGEIAADEVVEVFKAILWAYYFSVIRYSPAEVAEYAKSRDLSLPWKSALQEIQGTLIEHDVPDKYCPLFEAKVRELYPAPSLNVWQACDRLLDFGKAELANHYQWLVNSRFPWDRPSQRRQ
jgi:hypothetical protein